MATRDLFRCALLLLTMSALAAGVSACSGDGDDDDDTSPTPTLTPFEPTGCQIVWLTRDPPEQEQFVDYYLVDAPISSWITGEHNYYLGDPTGATNVSGAFVNDYDLVERTYAAAAFATSGEFSLVVDSNDALAAGTSVSFDDPDYQEYFLLDTAGNLGMSVGATGSGSFDGVWSPPLPMSDVEEGSGTVTFAFFSTNLTLGADLAYAVCYDAGSFAPFTLDQKVKMAGDRAGALLRSR